MYQCDIDQLQVDDCEYYFRPVKNRAEYYALIPLYSFVYFLLFGPPC